MRRFFLLLLPLALMLAACADKAPDENTEESMKAEKELILYVNGNELNVIWEDNDTVEELKACAQDKPITVQTTLYGGFEQVGALPQSFSRNDVQTTTETGDIVLYSGNQFMLFFGANTWCYTMLGHIEGLSAQELEELLGAESATVELKIS